MGRLTAKQRKFFNEYLIDHNGAQAAIRAGYSRKTAKAIASDLLKKKEIREAIAERQNTIQAETGITQERVLEGYAKLAFFDVRRLYDENGNLLPIHKLDADTAIAIAGFDVVEVDKGNGVVERTKKVRLVERKGALDSIARTLGMFQDKVQHTGKDDAPLFPRETNNLEIARRLLFMLRLGANDAERTQCNRENQR